MTELKLGGKSYFYIPLLPVQNVWGGGGENSEITNCFSIQRALSLWADYSHSQELNCEILRNTT